MNHVPAGAAPGVAAQAVGRTAWLLSYNYIYRTLMYVLMIVAPSCLLLKRPASGTHIDTAIE
jgi:hypothetical protein